MENKEKEMEVRLKQLEQVNKKLETETNLNEIAKLEATGKFLINIIRKYG
jgi:hypothetical protein